MPSLSDDGYQVPALPPALAQKANALLTQKFGTPNPLFEKWWCFGDERGNRIDLGRIETGGAELSARIDARINAEPFCKTVCEIAAQLDCLIFLAAHNKAIEPEAVQLLSALRNSRAFAFACDPQGFLKGVQRGG